MKAMLWTRYGPPEVLQLTELEKPTPKDNEVLIQVCAATVLIADCELRALKVPLALRLPLRLLLGVFKPVRRTILGQELSGVVEAAGRGVTRFKPGDEVLAPTLFRLGAYSEYTCLPESYPVLKPPGISFEEAATIPTGGINGLHFIRAAGVRRGQSVLINGAGGSIGTYAVQIAKSLGAGVTAVDSAEKAAMLHSIGADFVCDYAREDFTQRVEAYDVIIDVAGKAPFARTLRALRPDGVFVMGNAGVADQIRARLARPGSGKRVFYTVAEHKKEYYTQLLQQIEAGAILPVIDRRFRLEDLAEAQRYVEAGHKKGSVVISMAHAA